MSWDEFKKMVDERLKQSGVKGEDVEINYIDINYTDVENTDVEIIKLDNGNACLQILD